MLGLGRVAAPESHSASSEFRVVRVAGLGLGRGGGARERGAARGGDPAVPAAHAGSDGMMVLAVR